MSCSVEDCSRSAVSRGFCTLHYRRWTKHGDPMKVSPSRWHPVDKRCSIENCNKQRWARGWCTMHYKRWRLLGDPLKVLRPAPLSISVEERFWNKVIKTESCWTWNGGKTAENYGIFGINSRNRVMAHRYAYELLTGSKLDGLELDHECHNRDLSCNLSAKCPHRLCVNPDHLVPRTPEEHRAQAWIDRRKR